MDKKRKKEFNIESHQKLEEHYKQIFIKQKRENERTIELQKEKIIEEANSWKSEFIKEHNILLKQNKLLEFENNKLKRQQQHQKQKYEKAISVQYKMLCQLNPNKIPDDLQKMLDKTIYYIDLWTLD